MTNLYKIKWLNIVLVVILAFCVLSIAGFSQENKIIIKLGHHHPIESILDKTAHKLSEVVEEKTNGRVKIEIYPGSQLGEEMEACEGILMGSLQMTIVTPSFFQDVAKGFGIDALPYMFKDNKQANLVLNESSVGEELNRRLIEKGARILAWIPLGMEVLLFKNKDIKRFEDLKGLKMRSPENEIYINMLRAWGCRPAAITWGEAYTALKTGVVDGMAGSPISTILDNKFYEVAEYCLLTNNISAQMMILINEKSFQGLPKHIQEIIVQAGREAAVYGGELNDKITKRAKTFLEEKGMKFNEVTEEDLLKFKEAVVPVVNKWGEEHESQDLIEEISKLNK